MQRSVTVTFTFENPERRIVAGANWTVLEYLIDRFNRPGLEGSIVLRRTSMLRDLQLCLSGEYCGAPLTTLSASFEDKLITDAEQKERLVNLVSRFLLKAKQLHEKRCGSALPTPQQSDESSVA